MVSFHVIICRSNAHLSSVLNFFNIISLFRIVSSSDVTPTNPLAEHLIHMVHLFGNTSGVSKSSSDWLDYTGFPGDVCVTFFNVPPGNKDAVMPNPLTK